MPPARLVLIKMISDGRDPPRTESIMARESERRKALAPLRTDPRQQQKLNEPFKERGRSAGTSVQMPGLGWQCPGLRRGISALPALCKGSQEFWTPCKAVAAEQVGVGRSSPLISAGPVVLQAEPAYMCSGWFWRHLMISVTGLPS